MLVRLRKIIRSLILPESLVVNFVKQLQLFKVLDIGAGTGFVMEIFKKNNLCQEYYGTEIKSSYFGKAFTGFEIGSAEDRSSGYDGVIFCDVLHHVNPAQLMDNYASELKAAKYVFVKEMNPRNVFCKYWNRIHDIIFSRDTANELTPLEVDELMKTFHKKRIKYFEKRIFLYDHYFILYGNES